MRYLFVHNSIIFHQLKEGEKELLKAIELEPTRGNFFGNLG